ncbi:hypothetical protein PVMG_01431 [Plasmodium vivax Mauritania I]|uniref:VIR protein n=1 Tax=Plasmodium vivax Mauritania I TaxID=1035515 RepID=A0A0J9TBJ8_PLAVI|nr:hypothetical protein PVMG_01431 [Plasmodium vivax Mauritania I]
MAGDNSDPRYVAYSNYVDAKTQYNRYTGLYDEKKDLDEILKNINDKRNKLQLPDSFFNKLHKLLRNSTPFYWGNGPNYCRYVNYRLNKEVRDTYHRVNESNFDILHTFVVNFNKKKHNNEKSTCYGHIEYLNDIVYNRMKILYDFYTLYDDLRSSTNLMSDEQCKSLLFNTYMYNEVINDYYNDYPDLYKKISDVKDLIEEKLKKLDKKCEETKAFRKPQKLVEEERKKEQDRIAEEERKKEEQDRLDRLREQTEAQARMKQITDDMQLQHETLQQVSQFREEPEIVRYSEDTKAPGYSPLLKSRGTLDPSVRFTNLEAAIPQPYRDQLEGLDDRQEVNARTEPKNFLGSLGLPDSITGVLGQVDPIPVVGVSGGMGALFLLFRVLKILNFHPYTYNIFT